MTLDTPPGHGTHGGHTARGCPPDELLHWPLCLMPVPSTRSRLSRRLLLPLSGNGWPWGPATWTLSSRPRLRLLLVQALRAWWALMCSKTHLGRQTPASRKSLASKMLPSSSRMLLLGAFSRSRSPVPCRDCHIQLRGESWSLLDSLPARRSARHRRRRNGCAWYSRSRQGWPVRRSTLPLGRPPFHPGQRHLCSSSAALLTWRTKYGIPSGTQGPPTFATWGACLAATSSAW